MMKPKPYLTYKSLSKVLFIRVVLDSTSTSRDMEEHIIPENSAIVPF